MSRSRSSIRPKSRTPARCNLCFGRPVRPVRDAPGGSVLSRIAARLTSRSPWSENAVRVLAGTGGEWPRARRLLSPDRTGAVADLQRRRRSQSGARRVLRARRLSVPRNHQISRLRRGGRDLADRGRDARHSVRALHPAPVLHRRSDPEPAGDLRTCDGRRADDPHHLGRVPIAGFDPAGVPRLGDRRRLPVLALPPDAAGGGRRGTARASGCCCTRPRSAASCAPASSGRTWSPRSASGCSPT